MSPGEYAGFADKLVLIEDDSPLEKLEPVNETPIKDASIEVIPMPVIGPAITIDGEDAASVGVANGGKQVIQDLEIDNLEALVTTEDDSEEPAKRRGRPRKG